MVQRTSSRRSAVASAMKVALAVVASITLLYSCQAAKAQEKDQQIAETYVLSTGDNVETTFRVLADQIGIVPADELPFEAVVDIVNENWARYRQGQ